ncbi:MAG: 2-phospho-L-lactate transferase [Chloroflexi bacterium]|nr:MAG: 2-phospho-L-lactate transferase [Chloroflexota bacterium]
MNTLPDFNIVCLAGGVGGAKLAEGLAQIVPPENLSIIVNTGDDFTHLGLTICPDLDTVLYTLGAVANPETGWGRQSETWQVMDELAQLQGPDWFRLGDKDLALHLTRAHMLQEGNSLTAVTRHLCQTLNVSAEILPMSDHPAPTHIQTEAERLSFQTWFVQKKWQPPVKQVILPEMVHTSAQVAKRLEKADVVLIAPSNPFVSIDPILNIYPVREMVMDLPQAVIAVSPIIGDSAVKGPAAKMMKELGMAASATAVANYYGQLIDGFVYDTADANPLGRTDIAALRTNTLMKNGDSRRRVAEETLAFAQQIIAGE